MQSINNLSTLVTGQFHKLAERYGVTPEYLASIAIQAFVDDAPEALQVVSASPLGEQDCDDCALREQCGSVNRRSRERRLICFEKLGAGVAALLVLATGFCLPVRPRRDQFRALRPLTNLIQGHRP